MPPQCCWILSLGVDQRFTSHDTARYKTDFNALSLARVSLDEGWDRAFTEPNRIFGMALLDPDFVYHALADMDDSARQQYKFWRSVFGDMHGRLYFFFVKAAVPFDPPVQLGIQNANKLKTMFASLEGREVAQLVASLQESGAVLPDWFDRDCTLCLRMPVAFACQAMCGAWSFVAVPDPSPGQLFNPTAQRSRLAGWSHCPTLQDQFEELPVLGADPQERLNLDSAGFVVDTLRKAAVRLDPHDPAEKQLLESCQRAAHLLQAFEDDLDPASMHQGILSTRGRVTASNLPYQAAFLIKCLMLSCYLRDSKNLKKVLERSVEAVVPRSMSGAVLEALKDVHLPTPTKLSRARFIVDVAFMLFKRTVHSSSLDSSVRYIMVDSSVQGHHDFELIRATTLDLTSAADMYAAAQELQTLWAPMQEHVADAVWMDRHLPLASSQEALLYERISAGLSTHLFPSVVIGSGFSTLWHKFHAVAHSFWLETGDALSLERFCSSIFSFTTDQGVEFSLPKVPATPVRHVLPWVPIPEFQQEHDLAPGPDLGDLHAAARINFSGAVGIPGMCHIIHNSTVDLGRAMNQFSEVVSQMQHLSRFLRKKDSKQRLLETCFSSRVGRHLQKPILAFTAKLHTGRWGTVSACVTQLLEALRLC